MYIYPIKRPPTTNNRPEDAEQIAWIKNWLTLRRDILQKNAEVTTWTYDKYEPKRNTGDVRDAGWTVEHYFNPWNPFVYFKGYDPTYNRINKLIYALVENAANTPKLNVGPGSSRDYDMRGVYVEPNYFDNSGNYVAFAGQLIDPSVKVHEFTHASHPTLQELYISDVVFKDRDIPIVAPKAKTRIANAKEIYGALQEFRYKNKLNPKLKITKKWIIDHRDLFKGNYLDKLSDDDKVTLFNDVARNEMPQNTILPLMYNV